MQSIGSDDLANRTSVKVFHRYTDPTYSGFRARAAFCNRFLRFQVSANQFPAAINTRRFRTTF